MSKKTGKRTKKKEQASSKTEKRKLTDIPDWNDEILSAILNNSHDGIVILGDNYQFEYINERGLAVYGGPASDLMGQDFRKFMKDDMAKMVAEHYDRRRKGEDVPPVYPFRLVRKDGIEVTVEGRVSMVIGPDKKQIRPATL